jgi:hypothetical protein
VLGEIESLGHWPIRREKEWWETWVTYRNALVGALDHEDLGAVRHAFGLARRLQEGLLDRERPLVPTDPPFFTETRTAVTDARARLSV